MDRTTHSNRDLVRSIVAWDSGEPFDLEPRTDGALRYGYGGTTLSVDHWLLYGRKHHSWSRRLGETIRSSESTRGRGHRRRHHKHRLRLWFTLASSVPRYNNLPWSDFPRPQDRYFAPKEWRSRAESKNNPIPVFTSILSDIGAILECDSRS